jgi:hypothetical protein
MIDHHIPSCIWLWNISIFFWRFTANIFRKLSDSSGNLFRCVSGVNAVSYSDLLRVFYGEFCHYLFGCLRKNISDVFTKVLPWIFFVFFCRSYINYLYFFDVSLWIISVFYEMTCDELSRYFTGLVVVKFLDDFRTHLPYLFGYFLSQITKFI